MMAVTATTWQAIGKYGFATVLATLFFFMFRSTFEKQGQQLKAISEKQGAQLETMHKDSVEIGRAHV